MTEKLYGLEMDEADGHISETKPSAGFWGYFPELGSEQEGQVLPLISHVQDCECHIVGLTLMALLKLR